MMEWLIIHGAGLPLRYVEIGAHARYQAVRLSIDTHANVKSSVKFAGRGNLAVMATDQNANSVPNWAPTASIASLV